MRWRIQSCEYNSHTKGSLSSPKPFACLCGRRRMNLLFSFWGRMGLQKASGHAGPGHCECPGKASCPSKAGCKAFGCRLPAKGFLSSPKPFACLCERRRMNLLFCFLGGRVSKRRLATQARGIVNARAKLPVRQRPGARLSAAVCPHWQSGGRIGRYSASIALHEKAPGLIAGRFFLIPPRPGRAWLPRRRR